MMKDKYLKESLNTQRLNELASKYGISNYIPGQSFDTHKNKMSAEDYETSQKLLNYYTNQKTLTDDFNYNTEKVNQNRDRTLQENAVSKEMTMKYLPEYLKLQGMGGLGVSESAVISANNDFRNARNTINADAESQKADLLKNYQDNMSVLDNGSTDDVKTIGEKYSKIRENLANDESTIIETQFQNMIGSDGKISQGDLDSLKSYVKGLKETIGEENVERLEIQLKGYSPYVRSDAQQDTHDKEVTLENYRTGVGIGDGVKVHDTYGGGYTLSDNMKIKIKDGDEGISLQEFIDRSGKSGSGGLNHGEAGWFGSEKKDSKSIAALAQKGQLSNGTIVDTNAGDGQNMWVYLNGRFYKIEKTQ